MDIATAAQILSSLATLVVATGILYQGREARKARNDEDRPQIIVDADYTGRFTTNIVVRNIGHGMAKNVTFEFSASIETTEGRDITELPYFKHGINFMAPQTDLPTVWDSLPERGTEPERQGPDGRHYDHLEVRGPPGGGLRDRVDDQPAAPGRERVL